MHKYLRTGAVLIAVQAVLIGGYLWVARGRSDVHDAPTAPVVRAPEAMASPMPDLRLHYVDGSSKNLAELSQRPLLLHFWATWCPPCRKELPGLLALAENGSTKVLLIALDEDWAPVRRFLDGPVPAHVALADADQVASRFGVHQLPETFVVDGAGNLTLRFRGAQDWTSAVTLALLPPAQRRGLDIGARER